MDTCTSTIMTEKLYGCTATLPKYRRICAWAAVMGSALWILSWIVLNMRFSGSGFGDLYQNSAPLAVQQHPLDLRYPLLGGFPPYSDGWGSQWPFYMALKSLVFSVIPWNLDTVFLLGLSISIGSAALAYHGLTRITDNPFLLCLGPLVILTDRHLLFHIGNARGEPLLCLCLLLLLVQARKLTTDDAGGKHLPWYLLAFFLLPGLHPIGLMLGGGLLALHLALFRQLYPQVSKTLLWSPLAAYASGLLLFATWYLVQPAAWEQMKINLQVQDAIYATASRWTFFKPFLPSLPLGSGFTLWGAALASGLFVAAKTAASLFLRKSRILSPDMVFAAAIVVALPVIGFLFRIDNFFYYAAGTSAAVYLVGGISALATTISRAAIPTVVLVLAWSIASSFALPAWRMANFIKAGCPDLRAERRQILEEYRDARRIYIPTNLFPEALAADPEKFLCYKFPNPMLKEVRERYEKHAYQDARPGDILIVPSVPIPPPDRLMLRPVREFYPPDPTAWEYVTRHQRSLPGKADWGWDLTVYRHK